MMMTPGEIYYYDNAKEILAFRDVTSACDDDARVDMGFWDVTLAYDDDAKGNMGFWM